MTPMKDDALLTSLLGDKRHASPVIKTKCFECKDEPAQGMHAPDGNRDLCASCARDAKRNGRCADCGRVGERTGHQTCAYPQDRE